MSDSQLPLPARCFSSIERGDLRGGRDISELSRVRLSTCVRGISELMCFPLSARTADSGTDQPCYYPNAANDPVYTYSTPDGYPYKLADRDSGDICPGYPSAFMICADTSCPQPERLFVPFLLFICHTRPCSGFSSLASLARHQRPLSRATHPA